MANADGERLQGRKQHGALKTAKETGEPAPRWTTGKRCEALHDTVRSGCNGKHWRCESQEFADGRCWAAEPDVGRVANGVSNRVDRLKCLGNAVVPQQAYPIFCALREELKRMEEVRYGK